MWQTDRRLSAFAHTLKTFNIIASIRKLSFLQSLETTAYAKIPQVLPAASGAGGLFTYTLETGLFPSLMNFLRKCENK